MSAQPVIQSQPAKEYYLKALSGSLKSTVYRLTKKEIFIGRDASNHIVINDDAKVSRRHARLVFHKNQYYIQNLATNNFITLNGEKVKQGVLFNNCVLVIGAQSFKLVITESTPAKQNPNHLAAVKDESNSQISSQVNYSSQSYSNQNTKKVDQSSNKKVLFIIIGGLLALVIASSFLDSKPQIKKSQEEIETNEKILERIKKSQATIDAYKKSLDAKGANSKDYKRSKEFYIKGFRDFQKSQYSSAIGSFEVSLVHNPENIEAKRYLELSKRRAEELIEYHMNQGRAHKENFKFDFCISSFKNVMIQLNDKSDNRYAEAKKLLKECMLLQRSKY